MSTFNIDSEQIIKSLHLGLYAVDLQRKIVFWGEEAERITGWQAKDIVGRNCYDDFLCHVDKDNHRLCGEEHCPLYRAMITNQSSNTPIIVFAKGKNGKPIPMKVSVSPLHDDNGTVIGGLETFYDLSEEYHSIKQTQQIQERILSELPEPTKDIDFKVYNISNDIVGGDYYSIKRISDKEYWFFVADVTGHGVPAAFFTMYLNLLWNDAVCRFTSAEQVLSNINNRLCELLGNNCYFATAICGRIDLEKMLLTTVGAGGLEPMLFHNDGETESIDSKGMSLGLLKECSYTETVTQLAKGDKLLLFTDGVIEVFDKQDQQLSTSGLREILVSQGYPAQNLDFGQLEEAILKYSNHIRFDDDFTLIEFCF